MLHATELIKTREQLARWFSGEGIELGVAAGVYSQTILRVSRCTKLWSIDRWGDHHNDREYRLAAMKLVTEGKGRCIPLRMSFEEAAPLFADGTLDFIYIDGSHDEEDVASDLRGYWGLLREGGVLFGDDYDWPGVKAAVDRFAGDNGLRTELAGIQWVILHSLTDD